MHGTYEPVDGRPALRFERRLAHPIDVVWRAVTEPAELAHWFPGAVGVDLRLGGRMTFADEGFTSQEGEVTELDPPRVFAFSWGDDDLRFELEPTDGGAGCVLRFTHVIDASDRAARDAAGWHVCLDLLERHLAGAPTTGPGPEATEEWRRRYDEYRSRGLPAGAPVPQ
jgi:uncharacterized protein YndB with AHSA1/START domain